MFRTFSILLFTCLLSLQAYAQFTSPIGGWTAHLPYQSARWVTQSQDKVIFSTEWSLLTIDKQDLSRNTITKVDGLSDIGITRTAYDRANDQLLVAYNNSNLDVIKGDRVINLPNIKTNQALSGDRLVYDIHMVDHESALLATGFGIVELRLQTLDFGFTTRALRVNSISSLGTQYYAGTDDGLYRFDISQGEFAGDFNNWEFISANLGLDEVYEVSSLESFGGELFAVIDGVLHASDGQSPFREILNIDNGFDIQYLSAEGEHLVVGLRNTSNRSYTMLIDQAGGQKTINDGCINLTRYGVEDEQGRLWYADEWDLIRYHESDEGGCQQFVADSPFSEEVSDISFKGNKVYVSSGGVTDNFQYSFSRKGVYVFEQSDWTNINQDEYRLFRDRDIVNFFRVEPHPDLDLIYMGSYWAGLVEFNEETEEITIYNQSNSSLQGAVGDEVRERISALAFDRDNNLWVANYAAPEPISVLTPEGNWHSFNTDGISNLSNVTIDQNDYKWFPVFGISGGVLVFDHGDRIEDPTDDRYRFITPSNSELTTNIVNDIAVDREGSVWVGTGEGPVIFDCGDPFDDDCIGRRIKVLQDSIGAFLLADVDVKTIEVDGANRKWFGTNAGIFVQSPSGDEQELQFLESNSPLFDNNIIDLAYNGITGDMWIGTDKGLQVYRTSTSVGSRSHSSSVYSFPNPVPPDYEGPIGIRGLANDVNVKITDVNGKLVFETESLGGQALWDGRDFLGQKVSTGVYLVFSTTTGLFDDPDSYVTKIMVVR